MVVRAISTVVVLALATSCGGVVVRVPEAAPEPRLLAELWVDPGKTPRDLFWGPGGQKYAPPPQAAYAFINRDDTGFSASYDVTSPDGMEWSAKIGPEAQTEVVVSRILWGLGYHQPPLYYLPRWTLVRKGEEPRIESEARFRPKLDTLDRVEMWKWSDNPFTGTRELRGLLVVLLMLNSTDLKDDNNSLYMAKPPFGEGRWFVVRDVGAALGETGKLFPRRNWLKGFEETGFITGVNGNHVEFDYDGRHKELLDLLTPEDVRYGAGLMQRLTERQLQDASRAGNYSPQDAERFIRRIRQKVSDGLVVRARPVNDSH
jgi:hypothetical protein